VQALQLFLSLQRSAYSVLMNSLNLIKSNTMNLDADITWIQNEIAKIKDPDLIQLFKSLLQYREKKASADGLDLLLDKSMNDLKEGRTKPHGAVKSKYDKWL
jgi:hypothetical protein